MGKGWNGYRRLRAVRTPSRVRPKEQTREERVSGSGEVMPRRRARLLVRAYDNLHSRSFRENCRGIWQTAKYMASKARASDEEDGS